MSVELKVHSPVGITHPEHMSAASQASAGGHLTLSTSGKQRHHAARKSSAVEKPSVQCGAGAVRPCRPYQVSFHITRRCVRQRGALVLRFVDVSFHAAPQLGNAINACAHEEASVTAS